ncbi:glutathione S-transferase family protein [uncultured Sulfitobacter sp.]|uniref:glutathione S-transferase family protein n=1 Tax=uncultured Sulfitobacter sp. TaxID=191468 RepID=UPI00262143A8|nr:glutathione S-transferase family protein [uncultured Sulfitobacter sp.]
MTDPVHEIILHNYPQSPVAEKVRVAFGIKGLAWRSVEIPRLAPKPMLTKLTGGYRRTPVMQIGADIYCDTQCILRTLEQRHPQPTFFPTDDAGLMWCLSRWTDGAFFDLAVKIVLGSAGDALPQDFAQDRGRLYLGQDWAEGLRSANKEIPHLAAQIRAPLSWANRQLGDGRGFLLGDAPASIDAQLFHLVWFLRGRWDQGPAFLSQFTHLVRWEAAVAALGHGTMTGMTAQEAIARAAACEPVTVSRTDPRDPQGLKSGMRVTVSPDLDGGEQPVAGEIIVADCDTVSVRRHEPEVGEICVHFPRAGYRVDIED